MKVNCYCCDKKINPDEANGVTSHYGTRYFCDTPLCQEVFTDMATADEYIYDGGE